MIDDTAADRHDDEGENEEHDDEGENEEHDEDREGCVLGKDCCCPNIDHSASECFDAAMSRAHEEEAVAAELRDQGVSEDWSLQRRFESDDNDIQLVGEETELVMFMGGNGDWYIGVALVGRNACIGSVRIRTSGGEATHLPGLIVALAKLYQALPEPEKE